MYVERLTDRKGVHSKEGRPGPEAASSTDTDTDFPKQIREHTKTSAAVHVSSSPSHDSFPRRNGATARNLKFGRDALDIGNKSKCLVQAHDLPGYQPATEPGQQRVFEGSIRSVI